MTTEIAVIETPSIVEQVSVSFQSRALTTAETEKLNYHLSNSRSENTRIAYEGQWKSFIRWAVSNHFLPFPVSTTTLCLYLSHLSEQGHKRSKIDQALAAIKAVHQDNDHTTLSTFAHPSIKSTLNSIRRTMASDGRSSVSKPRVFSQGDVLAMIEATPSTPQGVQDKAILLLGVNAGLRASEFCQLTTEDLAFEQTGVDIRIRSSKTDQYGKSEQVFVGSLAPHLGTLDAVKALKQWMKYRETYPTAEKELFIAFRKGGITVHRMKGKVHGLNREAITGVLVRMATRAGLEVGNQSISSHGMRHSFITQAFARHIDAARISKQSRHKSLSSLMAYDQTSRKEATVSPQLWV